MMTLRCCFSCQSRCSVALNLNCYVHVGCVHVWSCSARPLCSAYPLRSAPSTGTNPSSALGEWPCFPRRHVPSTALHRLISCFWLSFCVYRPSQDSRFCVGCDTGLHTPALQPMGSEIGNSSQCCASLSLSGNHATVQFADGSRQDVPADVLRRSTVLRQALCENYSANTAAFDVPEQIVRSWLQWLREESQLSVGNSADCQHPRTDRQGFEQHNPSVIVHYLMVCALDTSSTHIRSEQRAVYIEDVIAIGTACITAVLRYHYWDSSLHLIISLQHTHKFRDQAVTAYTASAMLHACEPLDPSSQTAECQWRLSLLTYAEMCP